MDNFDIPYTVHDMSRIIRNTERPHVRQGSVIFYTDGSKINANTGAGLFGLNLKKIDRNANMADCFSGRDLCDNRMCRVVPQKKIPTFQHLYLL